jgi:hypothetical protein
MVSPNDIRNQLASYLANEVAFAQFEDWLIDNAWNMHKDSSVEAQELVTEINSVIYEYLDGYINENALRLRLAPQVQRYRVMAASATPLYRPASSSSLESRRLAYG